MSPAGGGRPPRGRGRGSLAPAPAILPYLSVSHVHVSENTVIRVPFEKAEGEANDTRSCIPPARARRPNQAQALSCLDRLSNALTLSHVTKG
jgi:hypothetical protein